MRCVPAKLVVQTLTAIAMLCVLVRSAISQEKTSPTAPFANQKDVIDLSDDLRTQSLEVLRGALRSDEFWPAIHAAEGLTLAGHGDEVRAFLEPKLSDEKDDQRQCGLARELVRAGDRQKAQIMLDILAGPDPHGHVHAAESLYKVNEIGDGVAMRRAFQQTENIRWRMGLGESFL